MSLAMRLSSLPAPGGIMRQHHERVATTRAAIDYLMSRTETELAQPVPNCPGWTVRHVAVHVARVCVAWDQMMQYLPSDADARLKAYEVSDGRPEGASMQELAEWAYAAIDRTAGAETECYFSMTGGPGTTAMWAWHAAAEIGVHRLDVEAALGHDHAMTVDESVDAATYVATYFMPAMRRVTGVDPGSLRADLLGAGDSMAGSAEVGSDSPDRVVLSGPAMQVLLALWGRPYSAVEVVEGDAMVLNRWRELPKQAFQFGTKE
jgi:uncharacterized protein (TIGR03083 family)